MRCRRTLWAGVMVGLILGLLANGAAALAANLLQNGSFERGELGGPPVGWAAKGSTEAVRGSYKSVTGGCIGSRALAVECLEATGVYAVFSQPIDLETSGGERLLFACQYRTEGAPVPELSITTFAEDFRVREWSTVPLQAEAQTLAASPGWRAAAWHFECLPGTRQVIVMFRLNGQGKLFVDGASLVRYPGEVQCDLEAVGRIAKLNAGRQCVIRVKNAASGARAILASLVPVKDGKPQKAVTQETELRAGEERLLTLDWSYDYRQTPEAIVTVAAKDQSEVYECRIERAPGLLVARIAEPVFRGHLLGSIPGTDIVVSGRINLAEPLLSQATVEAELLGTEERVTAMPQRGSGSSAGDFSLTLNGQRLLSGAHTLRVTASVGGAKESLSLPVKRIVGAGFEVATDRGGRVMINGRPFFARGIFDATEPELLGPVAEAGFNLVVVPYRRASSALLARASELDLRVVVSGLLTEVDPQFWGGQEQRLGSYSSLLGWYHPVEDSSGARILPAAAAAFHASAAELIPRRPLVAGLRSMSTAAEYAEAGDVLAAWIAPRPGTDDRAVTMMMDAVARAAGRRPVWAILDVSGFSWYAPTGAPDDTGPPRPSPEQARAMTYLALMHGARGIVYYTYWAPKYRSLPELLLPRDDPALWEALQTLNDETKWLEPLILNGTRTLLEPLAGGLVHAAVFEGAEGKYLIGASVTSKPVMVSFTPPGDPASLPVMFEDRELQPAGPGTFADSFGPHAVHIYKLP